MMVILYAIKILVTIHLLVCRLGYYEAIVSIALGDHKAVILLLLCYQCMNCYACK